MTGIDGTLILGGSISGRITDSSGVPIAGANAYVYSSDTARPGQWFTDAAGNYKVSRLRPGNYAVRFRTSGALATEWYSDETSFADILPVPVVAGATTAGIDAALGTPGAIAGHVTDGIGNPIAGVTVSVNDVSGIALWTGTTNGSGNYYIGRLPEGQFIVYFNAATAMGANVASQYFPNQRFSADAYHVAVFAGQTMGGTDAILETAGQLTGRVSDGEGIGLSGASVVAYDADSDFSVGATTDAMGNYSLRNLPPDTYKVRFRTPAGDHAVEWYGDKTSFATADPVAVTAGATLTDVNAELSDVMATITGRVTKPGGGGIENVIVVAYDATRAAPLGSAATNAAGDYSISGLPTGSVKVQFDADKPYLAYLSEYYIDSASHGAASLVAVTAGETTSGIDAVLADVPALGVTTVSLPGGELAVPYSQTLAGLGRPPVLSLDPRLGRSAQRLDAQRQGRDDRHPDGDGHVRFHRPGHRFDVPPEGGDSGAFHHDRRLLGAGIHDQRPGDLGR